MEKDNRETKSLNTRAYFKDLIDQAGVGIITFNENMFIEFINLEALNIFGYSNSELDKIIFTKLFHNSNKKELDDIFKGIKDNPAHHIFTLQFTGVHKDYSAFPVEVSLSKNKYHNETLFTAVIRDITESKNNEENLKYQAYFDQLTAIPNRRLFSDRAENALNQAKRSNEGLAIIFIDLDEFKEINDTYGHETGDIFLKAVAQRFINSARKSDTVSRLGGDEFTILMPRIKNAKDAANLAERILNTNKEAITINKNHLFPKTSIGISVYPEDGETIEMLLSKADKAMYIAKNLGKNRYIFFQNC